VEYYGTARAATCSSRPRRKTELKAKATPARLSMHVAATRTVGV
jgi:hypothetical protein